MKTLILSLAIAIISITNLNSQEFPFKAERLITDFNGVVYNGTNILCYGNWGIITYSEDKGETWRQTNIGDEHDIIKIININNIFYGATKYNIIKSTDNGMSWEFKKIDTLLNIMNIAINNENIYVNTGNKILRCDLELEFELDFEMNCNAEIELFKEIATNEEYLFTILQNEYGHNLVLKSNIETSKIDTLDLLPLNLCSSCDKLTKLNLSNLKYESNMISLFIENYQSNWQTSYTLVISSNNGKDWNIVNKKLTSYAQTCKYDSITKTYKCISHIPLTLPKLSLVQIDYSEIVDTATILKINSSNENIRLITSQYVQGSVKEIFKELLRVDENIFISVGYNKTIAISKNNGNEWEFISNIEIIRVMNPYYNLSTYFYDSNIIIPKSIEGRTIYFSRNNLVTALPQLYDEDNYITNGNISSYYYDSMGSGVINYRNTILDSSNQLLTNDFGNSYIKIFSKPMLNKSFYDYGGIKNNNSIFFYNYEKFNTLLYRFDLEYNFIDSIIIDSVSNFWLHKTDDKSNFLYGFGNLGKNYNIDSSKFMTREYTFFTSIDNGSNWTKKAIQNGIYRSAKYFDNYVYLIIEQPLEKKIYIQNISNNYLDSIVIHNSYSLSYNPINKFQDKILITFKDGTFYSIENINNTFHLDSFHIKSYLKGWSQYDPFKLNTIDDILTNININNNIFYIESANFLSGSQLKSNIVRLTPKTHTSIENQIEIPTQMYVKKPYPLPARNTVNAEVYWDLRHDIDIADIGIYNSIGIRVGGRENILINKTAEYKGIVSWDCSGMPAGVYFIQIRHGDALKSIPVVVGK